MNRFKTGYGFVSFDSGQKKLSNKPNKEERELVRLEQAVKVVNVLIQEGLEDKVREKLVKVVERVAFECEKHPSCKGNYSLLVFYYRKDFEPKTGEFEHDVVYSTSPETITRAYRKLAEHGFYLPSAKTSLKRCELENEFRNILARVD